MPTIYEEDFSDFTPRDWQAYRRHQHMQAYYRANAMRGARYGGGFSIYGARRDPRLQNAVFSLRRHLPSRIRGYLKHKHSRRSAREAGLPSHLMNRGLSPYAVRHISSFLP